MYRPRQPSTGCGTFAQHFCCKRLRINVTFKDPWAEIVPELPRCKACDCRFAPTHGFNLLFLKAAKRESKAETVSHNHLQSQLHEFRFIHGLHIRQQATQERATMATAPEPSSFKLMVAGPVNSFCELLDFKVLSGNAAQAADRSGKVAGRCLQ